MIKDDDKNVAYIIGKVVKEVDSIKVYSLGDEIPKVDLITITPFFYEG